MKTECIADVTRVGRVGGSPNQALKEATNGKVHLF
jgi:hypothetical protein